MRNICQRNFDVQFYLRFLYTRFPRLCYLHADSITRAIHYDVLYTLFPLPAQSVPPKMTITRSFITRALSHPKMIILGSLESA